MAIVYDKKGDSHDVPHAIDLKDWLDNGYSLEKPSKKAPIKKETEK